MCYGYDSATSGVLQSTLSDFLVLAFLFVYSELIQAKPYLGTEVHLSYSTFSGNIFCLLVT